MTDAKEPTPAFSQVAGVMIDGDSVVIRMEREDGKILSLPFSVECVPAVIGMLIAGTQKLARYQPDFASGQSLKVESAQLAMKDTGEAVLIMGIEDGAELPLVITPAALTGLRGLLKEAAKMVDRSSQH